MKEPVAGPTGAEDHDVERRESGPRSGSREEAERNDGSLARVGLCPRARAHYRAHNGRGQTGGGSAGARRPTGIVVVSARLAKEIRGRPGCFTDHLASFFFNTRAVSGFVD